MFRPSVWKVVKTKKVLFSKINMSLLPFFYFFLWRKKWILGPFCDFGPNAKMVFFPFLLWIFFNEYIFLVQTHVRWDYRGRTGGNLNEFILLIGPIVVCRGLNRPCGAWPLLVTHYWIFCRQGSWSPLVSKGRLSQELRSSLLQLNELVGPLEVLDFHLHLIRELGCN